MISIVLTSLNPFARKTSQLGYNYCLDSNFQLVVFIRFCPVDIETKPISGHYTE
jgi:hypothetical protein